MIRLSEGDIDTESEDTRSLSEGDIVIKGRNGRMRKLLRRPE